MSALHLLDDFIESVETIPSEIQQQLQLLHEKDFQIEDLQKNLFKKRTVLLKANEKNFDESMQISLKKRAEKDAQKVSHLLDEKIQIQENLLQIVEQHQQRLLKEVYKPLELTPDSGNFYQNETFFGDIPEPQLANNSGNKKSSSSSNLMKQAQTGNVSSSLSSVSSSGSLSRETLKDNFNNNSSSFSNNAGNNVQSAPRTTSPRPPLLTISSETEMSRDLSHKISPKKRASLEDDPSIDPNEPIYCYCKQVSWGEMVACDGPNCQNEWFHLTCAGLNAPPQGKWYCNDCKNKK